MWVYSAGLRGVEVGNGAHGDHPVVNGMSVRIVEPEKTPAVSRRHASARGGLLSTVPAMEHQDQGAARERATNVATWYPSEV